MLPPAMAKERVSASASLALSRPVSAEDVVAVDCLISAIAAGGGARRDGASSSPLMLMLMVCCVPSEAVSVKESEPFWPDRSGGGLVSE